MWVWKTISCSRRSYSNRSFRSSCSRSCQEWNRQNGCFCDSDVGKIGCSVEIYSRFVHFCFSVVFFRSLFFIVFLFWFGFLLCSCGFSSHSWVSLASFFRDSHCWKIRSTSSRHYYRSVFVTQEGKKHDRTGFLLPSFRVFAVLCILFSIFTRSLLCSLVRLFPQFDRLSLFVLFWLILIGRWFGSSGWYLTLETWCSCCCCHSRKIARSGQ